MRNKQQSMFVTQNMQGIETNTKGKSFILWPRERKSFSCDMTFPCIQRNLGGMEGFVADMAYLPTDVTY